MRPHREVAARLNDTPHVLLDVVAQSSSTVGEEDVGYRAVPADARSWFPLARSFLYSLPGWRCIQSHVLCVVFVHGNGMCCC